MPTKVELYKAIQDYRNSQCPKVNINSSKADLQRAYNQLYKDDPNFKQMNEDRKTKTTKTKNSTKPKKTKKTQPPKKKTVEELKKEIEQLRKDVQKSAENNKSEKLTANQQKMLKEITDKTREMIRLKKEAKLKKKKASNVREFFS